MKKIVCFVLCMLLVGGLVGCQSESSSSISKNEDDGHYHIPLGEGLPDYLSDLKVQIGEIDEELASQGVTNVYYFTDDSYLYIFNKENTSKLSVEELANAERDDKYSDYWTECTEVVDWNDGDGYHYGYFATYDDTQPDKGFFVQHLFFEQEDRYTEAEFHIPAIRMPLPINGWTIDLPTGYEDGSLKKSEISDDAIANYEPKYEGEYPYINVYEWDNTYDSYKDFAENELSVEYDMKHYEVINYEDINGNSHEVLLSIYDEDDEGTLETNYDITIDCGDKYVSIDFFVEKDDNYVRYIIPAIVSSISSK